ncbi:MAG: dihydrofolate reductase family protein [Firmicutes bacterium]|nr:dihydrofolate reductase family protein [Bacillota bacterium]MBQ9972484.1 dihydrofolate reductase family protein [Bacillota bacterium]
MDRARVICHMYASIDGKIQPDFHGHPDTSFAGQIYDDLTYAYGMAIGVGRNTVDEGYEIDLSKYAGIDVEYKDNIITDTIHYGVIFDRYGKMRWKSNIQEYDDIPPRRILEVITEQVSPEFIAYLNDMQIPYMFAGKDDLDPELFVQKLKRDYGIDTFVLNGGAMINAAFIAADMVDEISLVITPGIMGGRNELTFVGAEDTSAFPKFFKLKEVEQIGNNGVILRYFR